MHAGSAVLTPSRIAGRPLQRISPELRQAGLRAPSEWRIGPGPLASPAIILSTTRTFGICRPRSSRAGMEQGMIRGGSLTAGCERSSPDQGRSQHRRGGRGRRDRCEAGTGQPPDRADTRAAARRHKPPDGADARAAAGGITRRTEPTPAPQPGRHGPSICQPLLPGAAALAKESGSAAAGTADGRGRRRRDRERAAAIPRSTTIPVAPTESAKPASNDGGV
jgi:hypothetical protein